MFKPRLIPLILCICLPQLISGYEFRKMACFHGEGTLIPLKVPTYLASLSECGVLCATRNCTAYNYDGFRCFTENLRRQHPGIVCYRPLLISIARYNCKRNEYFLALTTNSSTHDPVECKCSQITSPPYYPEWIVYGGGEDSCLTNCKGEPCQIYHGSSYPCAVCTQPSCNFNEDLSWPAYLVMCKP